MVNYNLSGFDNATNFFLVTKEANTLVGNLFANLLLLIIFFAMFAIMKSRGNDTKVVFVTSAAIISVISGGLFFLEMIALQGLIIPIILLMASIIYLMFGGD